MEPTVQATLSLKPSRPHRIEKGHPWVYRSEIASLDGTYTNGDIVRVVNASKHLIGLGYINDRSEIVVRLLTRRDEPVDDAFIRQRILTAINRRNREIHDTEASRLVSSEGDGLPGLIVDRYGEYLSMQIMTLGMERLRPAVVEALRDLVTARGLYDKSDTSSRTLEGLEPRREVAWGQVPQRVSFLENGHTFVADLYGGHKTGFYLDQRDNRALAARWMGGRHVLDCFAYTGAFSIYAAVAGAASVTAVESAAGPIELGRLGAEANGVAERCEWVRGNVFEILRKFDEEKRRFQCVILDPPPFGKGQRSGRSAYKGHKEINLRALRILLPGGVLVTCSCFHYMGREELMRCLLEAAADARKTLRLLAEGRQPLDHPVVLQIPETAYLHAFFVEVEAG